MEIRYRFAILVALLHGASSLRMNSSKRSPWGESKHKKGPKFELKLAEAVAIFPGDVNLPPMDEVPCALAGTRFRAIVKPPDADTLYQWYRSVGKPDADPSWAEVWPTAAALASELVANPRWVVDQDVAELGCGLGVAGITASFLGAKSVLLLDREPFSLHCALATASLHGIDVRADIETPSNPRKTDFDTDRPPGPISAALFNWCDPNIPAAVDVVLASDVLYDDATVVSLANTVVKILQYQGRLLVVDPSRERSPGCRAAFVAALEATGASCAVTPLQSSDDEHGINSSIEPSVLVFAEWAN